MATANPSPHATTPPSSASQNFGLRVRKGGGVSGVAVLFGVAGIYLVYAGVKNVKLVEGIRYLMRGELPPENPAPFVASAVAAAGPATTGVSSTDSAAFASRSLPTRPVPISETVVIEGIRVHRLISVQVQLMVEAARRSNVTLKGGGYRSSAQQAATRLANGCTCTNSSSCCRTPTAPVGQSMHERGLAIDFDNCRTRSTPVFRWLAGNASRYGFKNLPSEPWHWSTNGS